MRTLLVCCLALSLAGPAAADCRKSRQVEHHLPSAGLTALDLTARAGDLTVRGTDDSLIRVVARLCADNADALAKMDVSHAVDNGTLSLDAVIPWKQDGFDTEYAYIDLELALPATLALEVRDSSGDLAVENASLRALQDSSGDILIRGNRHALSVKDSSGGIEVRGQNGALTLVDSSGDIDIEDVRGDVTIDNDSSGDIAIREVSGGVVVQRDSSGDIRIRDVGADVTIGEDSSGSIELRQIGGSVAIGSDGPGDIDAVDIDGDVEVRRKARGRIRTVRVKGDIVLPDA